MNAASPDRKANDCLKDYYAKYLFQPGFVIMCTQIRYARFVEVMIEINVREARQRLSELLDKVEAGEDVVLLRHGKASAVMSKPVQKIKKLPSMKTFRQSLGNNSEKSSTELLQEDRNAR